MDATDLGAIDLDSIDLDPTDLGSIDLGPTDWAIDELEPPTAPTFFLIHRSQNRVILNAAEVLEIARGAGLDDVRSGDFAGLTLRAQLRLAQTVSILAGVHGTGLLHAMFMRPGSCTIYFSMAADGRPVPATVGPLLTQSGSQLMDQ